MPQSTGQLLRNGKSPEAEFLIFLGKRAWISYRLLSCFCQQFCFFLNFLTCSRLLSHIRMCVLHLRPIEPRCDSWSCRRTLGLRFLPPPRVGPTSPISFRLLHSSPALWIVLPTPPPPTPPRSPLTRPRSRPRCPLKRVRRRSAIAAPKTPLPRPRPPRTLPAEVSHCAVLPLVSRNTLNW